MHILCLLFFLFTTPLSAQSLSKVFDHYLNYDVSVPSHVEDFAQNYHYIFITGFLNERAPFYWRDTINTLKDMGVEENEITIIHPSSKKSVEENKRLFEVRIEELSKRKQFIILAHSKGALEAFHYAWSNPEFVKKYVKAMFFFQAPFGGSPIADQLYIGTMHDMSRMPFHLKLSMSMQFYLENKMLQPYHEGLKDLTTLEGKRRIDALAKSKTSLHEDIDDRFFYITSYETPNQTSLYLKNSSYFLTAYYGKNDGLVPTNRQSVPFIGKTIATVRADHIDFSIIYPLSYQESSFRISFTKALLTWLSKQDAS